MCDFKVWKESRYLSAVRDNSTSQTFLEQILIYAVPFYALSFSLNNNCLKRGISKDIKGYRLQHTHKEEHPLKDIALGH